MSKSAGGLPCPSVRYAIFVAEKQMAIMPGKENNMEIPVAAKEIKNENNYKVKEFKKAMEKYGNESFTLYIPKDRKRSGFLESTFGIFQLAGYVLSCQIGDFSCFRSYSAVNEHIVRDYDEFEELMEKEEFIRFDICQHKKNRGICVESEGVLLSKEEEGNFFCVMKMIKDVQAKEDDALEFAVLWYGKTNSGALKLRCYSHDKDYFDMFYVLGEECGSHGRS